MPLAQVPNLIPILPELFLACVAMALLLLGVFQKEEERQKTATLISYLAVISLGLTFILVIMLSGRKMLAFDGMFTTDLFAAFFKELVLFASAISLVISQRYLNAQQIARFEYPILVLFASLGMMLMISANSLIALYLGLELQSLALYVLAAFQRDETRSTEAGLKYFVLGAVASGMLLYGSSLVYGFAGTVAFDGLAQQLGNASADAPGLGLIVGIVFILAGLSFKVSAVPFHMWTPDVYEGAPTPVTAFFAVAPKIAAVALFVRVMAGPFGDLVAQWQQIIVFISIASMLLGAFAAVNQRNIKRLMAYSSIGHIGYTLIGLAVGNATGVRGILIYMTIYMFMNLGTFTCILCMSRKGRMVEDIDDLKGLSKSHPGVALALTIFMFSMAGIPPLAGFFGKLYIFLAAIESELYALAIIGVLSSVVAAFYYLRIIKLMYFDEASEAFDRPMGRELSVILVVTAVFTLFFFVSPEPLVGNAAAAAAALFEG